MSIRKTAKTTAELSIPESKAFGVNEKVQEQINMGLDSSKSINESIQRENEMSIYKSVVSSVEMILEGLKDLTIQEIRQVIDGACEIIKTREDDELSVIDRQIRELQEKRNQIRSTPVQQQVENGKRREIRALVNPKNPEQRYTVGIRPKWLEDWLKETGVDVSNRSAVYEQITKWKTEQSQDQQ